MDIFGRAEEIRQVDSEGFVDGGFVANTPIMKVPLRLLSRFAFGSFGVLVFGLCFDFVCFLRCFRICCSPFGLREGLLFG